MNPFEKRKNQASGFCHRIVVALALCAMTPCVFSAPVWQAPEPAVGEKIVALKGVRVVDYGDDYIWHVGGGGHFRAGPDRKSPAFRGKIQHVDVDGDGRSEEDCIAYLTYSLDTPIMTGEPYWDLEGANARIYGGVTGFFPDNQGKGGFSELLINVQETPDGDNLSVHTFNTKERHRNYHVFLWKKEDFLKGGAQHRVSLDETGLLVLHVMRGWSGMDDARFVLSDGDQFYISEYNFGTAEVQAEYKSAKEGIIIELNPDATRWAEYNPKAPYHIMFDRENAVFQKREFKDVQIAGYYVAKHEMAAREQGCKTYAFELFATVDRPERPSETLAMAKIKGSQEVPPFYISGTEIPYTLWKTVRRPAVAQMYGHEDYYPYMTDRDGDMGSMDYGLDGKLIEHSADEPVTDITWLDAVAWCNMLSEYEGREPVYYFTPNFDTIFRRVRERRMSHRRDGFYVPKVYVKWSADGYRLPTATEWESALGAKAPAESTQSVDGTSPVGSGMANEHGIYEMRGNVWEFVWGTEEFHDESAEGFKPEYTVLGGDFSSSIRTDQAEVTTEEIQSASAYGDEPYTGNYNIGFRVVRRGKGLPKPVLQSPVSNKAYPKWTVRKGEKTPGDKLSVVKEPLLDMASIPESHYKRWDSAKVFTSPFYVAKTELTYEKWKEVYDWAVERGYEFNKDGDMGSMDHRVGRYVHGPQEPVTDINRYDAILWCNALSEMEGKKPCYYFGNSGEKVVRRSHQYRRVWTHLPPIYKGEQFGELNWDMYKKLDKLSGWGCEVDWSADGYRLPTLAEWVVASKAGTQTRFYWGDDFDFEGKYVWSGDNSGGKTQPVGQKLTNDFGLSDMMGNVYEYCWGRDTGGRKQDFHETWNPKGEPHWGGESLHQVVQGGSFRYSGYWQSAFLPGGHGKGIKCFSTKSYPEIGFRVVRCEPRTHRRSGSEMPEDIQVLDVNLQEPVTPLQGSTQRANLQRTGVHYTKGVPSLKGLKWKFKTGGAIPAQPIVFRGTAYVHSSDAFVYAINAETGKEVWRYKAEGGPIDEMVGRPPAPTIKDGIMYLSCNKGYIYALDIRTGRPKWKTTVRGARAVYGSPVPVYGAVFAYLSASTDEGGFIALHGETGQILNIYRNYMWGAWQTWAFAEGNVIMCNHVGVSLLNLKTGARRGTPNIMPNHNTPVVHEGILYTAGGNIAAVDYRSGAKLYLKSLEGTDDTVGFNESRPASCENSLALWNDTMYFGSRNGYLYANNAKTGALRWKVKLADRIRSAPSISTPSHDAKKAIVYVGTDDGTLWALDAASGKQLWSFKAEDDRLRTDPWIEDGVVYFGSDGGYLYAVE